jgi:hypothetical protein
MSMVLFDGIRNAGAGLHHLCTHHGDDHDGRGRVRPARIPPLHRRWPQQPTGRGKPRNIARTIQRPEQFNADGQPPGRTAAEPRGGVDHKHGRALRSSLVPFLIPSSPDLIVAPARRLHSYHLVGDHFFKLFRCLDAASELPLERVADAGRRMRMRRVCTGTPVHAEYNVR